MQVTRAGYKDPNNLKFENITILGVLYPPTGVSSISRDGGSPTTLPHTVNYDAEKKVHKHKFDFSAWENLTEMSNIEKTGMDLKDAGILVFRDEKAEITLSSSRGGLDPAYTLRWLDWGLCPLMSE